ncbi:hypothetical protein QQ008_10480 [Fulvivirgaceae bacterium BMA10]|uniref:DUF4870 domain-containing protein n=1 Tax=Splendidivirga corallicola TaxID=3051826 RepID=A0ABT8KMW8_9BACT|nr:hypothetical protein [Fulvivirgaceae bacterium BMA10]
MENQEIKAPDHQEDKTVAIVSYITFVGWIVALVLHQNNKTSLGSYHLRQSLLLFIVAFAFYVVRMIFLFSGWFLSTIFSIVGLGLLVLWVFGLIAAINGEKKPIPIIGEKAQEMFSSVFE